MSVQTNPPSSRPSWTESDAAKNSQRSGLLRQFKILLAFGAALALAYSIPSFVGYYSIELMSIFVLNCLIVVSYRLTTTTGDWGLHHVTMIGIGAYTAAILAIRLDASILLTLPFAGIAAAVVAYVFAIPLTRTRNFAFFIASFAISEFIRLSWLAFDAPFGGPRGLSGIPDASLFGVSLSDPKTYFYFMSTVIILCIYVLYRLNASLMGRAWMAFQRDEALCESVGIDVIKGRRMALAVGGFFAGIAGGLLAHRLGAIDAKNFQLTVMIYVVIWTIVGGSRTFWGPLLGLCVMTYVFEATRPLEEWRPMVFGSVLILSMILIPNGLESLLTKAFKHLGTRRARL